MTGAQRLVEFGVICYDGQGRTGRLLLGTYRSRDEAEHEAARLGKTSRHPVEVKARVVDVSEWRPATGRCPVHLLTSCAEDCGWTS